MKVVFMSMIINKYCGVLCATDLCMALFPLTLEKVQRRTAEAPKERAGAAYSCLRLCRGREQMSYCPQSRGCCGERHLVHYVFGNRW
jgi:hypothetical protein